MIKCFVTDLDGTLFDGHGPSLFDLTQRNRNGLIKAKENGLTIAVASGRIIGYAKRIASMVPFQPQMIAGFNGAIMRYNEQPYFTYDMDRTTFKSLLETVKQLDGVSAIQLQTLDSMRVFEDVYSPLAVRYRKEVQSIGIGKVCDVPIAQWFDQYPSSKVGKLSVYTNNLDASNHIIKQLRPCFPNLNVTKSSPTVIEIMNERANKGSFIEFISQHTDWSVDEIAAIGDNSNDSAMTNMVKTSFGIASGDPQFLKTVTHVVADVAEAIDMILTNDYHGPTIRKE